MESSVVLHEPYNKEFGSRSRTDAIAPGEIQAALLTGGTDKHYSSGLAKGLSSKGVCLEVIGSDEIDCPEFHSSPRLRFLNLRGDQRRRAGLLSKASRVLIYYARLLRYARTAKPKVFHILWNNKFEVFDRTLLLFYYRVRGRKIVLTAHNVNAGRRDGSDSVLNRATLKIQYNFADHIFVHTEKMKQELIERFGVRERSVTVIPFGVNNAIPRTDLTRSEARQRLSICESEKTILFFGNIAPYKGLEFLVEAFRDIVKWRSDCRLIIAGRPRRGDEKYLNDIRQVISREIPPEAVIQRIGYVPDAEAELYFKAADVVALPYVDIFQSGVLFLAYSFGLPVIATDVGALREDIVEGQTGFLCKPCDSRALAATIKRYLESSLSEQLDSRQREIQDHVNRRHSWDLVSEITRDIYAELLKGSDEK